MNNWRFSFHTFLTANVSDVMWKSIFPRITEEHERRKCYKIPSLTIIYVCYPWRFLTSLTKLNTIIPFSIKFFLFVASNQTLIRFAQVNWFSNLCVFLHFSFKVCWAYCNLRYFLRFGCCTHTQLYEQINTRRQNEL